ncbi:MAG: DUF2179 domain-containing protein [Bacteroidia bacterium]
MDFSSFDYYNWVIFPILIFIARICDVSLAMLRTVLASKGYKNIVPFIGFFEVLIWLAAIGQIMNNLNNWVCYIAWAGGYATGSYIGLFIEEKIALGIQVIRIITNQESELLIKELKNNNFGLTILDAQGSRGAVKLIFTVVPRKSVKNVIEIIQKTTPNSFYSIEDVRNASQLNYIDSRKNIFSEIFGMRKAK